MKTDTITLAAALRLKNRLIAQGKKLESNLSSFNSVRVGVIRPYEVDKIFEDWKRNSDKITALKVLISTKNTKIQEKIFRLAEAKNQISVLGRLSTKNGTYFEGSRYDTGAAIETAYHAFLDQVDVDTLVGNLEAEIDTLQGEIDLFNATTRVNLPELISDDL